MFRAVFLGAPGVGKGTYTNIIAKQKGFAVLSLGELIRNQVKLQTSFGKEIEAYVKRGKLVPDEVVTRFVEEELEKLNPSNGGLLLDGFPRSLPQAEMLQRDMPLDCVLNLVMKKEYLIQKLLGRRICPICKSSFNIAEVENVEEDVKMPALLPRNGSYFTCDCGAKLEKREDDTMETIFKRLEIYNAETLPLVDYYKKLNILEQVEVRKG